MSDTTIKQRFFSTRETATILGRDIQVVRRLIQSGKLRARHTGARYLISQEAIDEFARGADAPLAAEESA